MKHKNTSAQNTILIAYIGKKYEYKYATSDYYMATIYAYNYSFLLAPALLAQERILQKSSSDRLLHLQRLIHLEW